MYVRGLHASVQVDYDANLEVTLRDPCDHFCDVMCGTRAHGLEQPGDCALPVSSGISVRAMAKAMKAAAAAPAMKKGRRRAMKARKAMK